MQELLMNLPKKSIRDVWIGSYGGHYTAIVIFHTKPNKVKEGWNSTTQKEHMIVDCLAEKSKIAACMWEIDFELMYPGANIPKPKDIEVTTLYKRRIEAFWTNDNRIEFPSFDCDGW